MAIFRAPSIYLQMVILAPVCGCLVAALPRMETTPILRPATTDPTRVTPTWGPNDYSTSIVQSASGGFTGAFILPNRSVIDTCDCDLGSSRVIVPPGWKY